MISIVVHGIIGAAYRQEIVLEGGSMEEGDIKSLRDIRNHLSTQYGDGTPTTGWALTSAPSGMWLSRVERAFDATTSPAYLMVSFLIPRGQRFKDDRALGVISKQMILNHSRYVSRGIIQEACDWSFLKPLSEELEGCLAPYEGEKMIYEEPVEGEVACYQGELSLMLQEMWSGKFSHFGTVFCGKGLLAEDWNYPYVEEVKEPVVNPSKDQHKVTRSPKNASKWWILVCVILSGLTLTFLLLESAWNHEGYYAGMLAQTTKWIAYVLWFVIYGIMMIPYVKKNKGWDCKHRICQLVALGVIIVGVPLLEILEPSSDSEYYSNQVARFLVCLYSILLIPSIKTDQENVEIEKPWFICGIFGALCVLLLCWIIESELFDYSSFFSRYFTQIMWLFYMVSYFALPLIIDKSKEKRLPSFWMGWSWIGLSFLLVLSLVSL